MRFVLLFPALLSPSKLSPPVSAPSPRTAMVKCSSLFSFIAVAMPSAADIEFELCPLMKASCSDSSGRVKPLSPFSVRIVPNLSARPVSSLWVYA